MDASRIAQEASRLLSLANRVLRRYTLPIRHVEHLATHSNVMFRVVTSRGEQLVLRVGTPHANTRTNIETEVQWLAALRRETNLDVVAPIPAVDGSLVVDELDLDLGKERPCVLFTWVPGSPLGVGAGPFAYRMLGQMSASLQAHGRTWQPPGIEPLRRWDRVFYYDQEIDPIVVGDPLYDHLFDVQRRSVIAKAVQSAERVIEASWSTGSPQVVHGDLHEWNVHMAGGRLYAFDFEDVMIALPAQDVAVSLYWSRTSEQRQSIKESFRRGFESVAPWPVEDDEQLDGFHAARQVMLMNYAARTLPLGEAADYVDRVMPWLEGYVRRYG